MNELISSSVDRIKDVCGNVDKNYIICGVSGLTATFLAYKTWRYFHTQTTDSKFYSLKPSENPRETKVLVIGLDDSGKTTFTRAFCKRRHRLDPTSERSIGEYIKQNNVIVGDLSICMYNLGGSIYCREMWSEFFDLNQLNFIIFCVDSSQPTRFVEARRELHKFLRNRHIKRTPLILLATKQDRVNAVDPYTLFLTMNLEGFQDTRPIHTVGVQINKGRTQGFTEVYHLLSTVDKQI